uniref:Myb/SANT-like DNA-binding domain-containing protein n=1 Tax=Sphaeramia orbicularis TaxID=375764 RepID=A0A673B5I3_9TELE
LEMSRGLTWSLDETRCLLDIWADVHVTQLLERTHKNANVFSLFSKRMKARGFVRSPEQCLVKVKKLRQTYMKVRDALAKSGSSGEAEEKFPYFNELDNILGSRPTVSPVDIVELHSPIDDDKCDASQGTPSPASSSLSHHVQVDDGNGE